MEFDIIKKQADYGTYSLKRWSRFRLMGKEAFSVVTLIANMMVI